MTDDVRASIDGKKEYWKMRRIHLHLRVYVCIRGTMPVRTHIHFRASNCLIEF